MTEAELHAQVTGLCWALGLAEVFHVRDSTGMRAGWPDLVIIGQAGMIFRELKSPRGRVTPEQWRVGYALQAIGADWAVWRPLHWHSGRIERELRALGCKRVAEGEAGWRARDS